MILAAILGASLSIFSRESLPRFSNWTITGGDATGRAPFAVEHGHFAECPATAQRGDGHGLAVGAGFLHGHLAGVDDAHEAAGIALAENRFTLGDGADAEIARRRSEVDRQQLVEQTAVHQPVADFFIQ